MSSRGRGLTGCVGAVVVILEAVERMHQAIEVEDRVVLLLEPAAQAVFFSFFFFSLSHSPTENALELPPTSFFGIVLNNIVFGENKRSTAGPR